MRRKATQRFQFFCKVSTSFCAKTPQCRCSFFFAQIPHTLRRFCATTPIPTFCRKSSRFRARRLLFPRSSSLPSAQTHADSAPHLFSPISANSPYFSAHCSYAPDSRLPAFECSCFACWPLCSDAFATSDSPTSARPRLAPLPPLFGPTEYCHHAFPPTSATAVTLLKLRAHGSSHRCTLCTSKARGFYFAQLQSHFQLNQTVHSLDAKTKYRTIRKPGLPTWTHAPTTNAEEGGTPPLLY